MNKSGLKRKRCNDSELKKKEFFEYETYGKLAADLSIFNRYSFWYVGSLFNWLGWMQNFTLCQLARDSRGLVGQKLGVSAEKADKILLLKEILADIRSRIWVDLLKY